MNAAYLLRNRLPKHGVGSQLISRLFCLTLLIVSSLFTMISARAATGNFTVQGGPLFLIRVARESLAVVSSVARSA